MSNFEFIHWEQMRISPYVSVSSLSQSLIFPLFCPCDHNPPGTHTGLIFPNRMHRELIVIQEKIFINYGEALAMSRSCVRVIAKVCVQLYSYKSL